MALPNVSTETVLGKEYTFTTTGGTPREWLGDGCSGVGRELGFLLPCPISIGRSEKHILLKVYRRRIQELFRKSLWYACPHCDQFWKA